MKNSIVGCWVVVMCASLAGCAAGGPECLRKEAPAASTSSPAPGSLPPGAEAIDGGTVTQPPVSSGAGNSGPSGGDP